MQAIVVKDESGRLSDGRRIRLFMLDNNNGCRVFLSEFGAAITSIKVPDKFGRPGEICLGYDDIAAYLADRQSIGVTTGRYTNRIANSRFSLNRKIYRLDTNIAPHHIHGGSRGFGKQAWQGEIIHGPDRAGVDFHRTSPDNECGYPGNMDITVSYRLSSENSLSIDYTAIGDQDCYLNLSNHTYFNLNGGGDIQNHRICIHSGRITPLSSELIALGEIKTVAGTPFDLRNPVSMGRGLRNPDSQMRMAGGYDINYIIGENDGLLKSAAYVFDPACGRSLTVNSTQPCLQFYTGNNLAGTQARDGSRLKKYAAFCLEAQDYPNGPNVTCFPTKPLLAGKTYRQRIEFIFGLNDHSD